MNHSLSKRCRPICISTHISTGSVWMSASLEQQQDPVVWIQKISCLDKQYERESKRLLSLLTSIWLVVYPHPTTASLFSSLLGALTLTSGRALAFSRNKTICYWSAWSGFKSTNNGEIISKILLSLFSFPSLLLLTLPSPFPRCRKVSQDEVRLVELVEDYDRALSDGLRHFTSLSSEENEQMIERMSESLADHSKRLAGSWEKQRKTLFDVSSLLPCCFSSDRPSLLIRALPSKPFRAMWTVVTPNSSHSVDKVSSDLHLWSR